jgi:cytochrome c oxidase cbb3-type subunit 3
MMAFVSDPGYWAAVPMPRPRIRSDQLKAVADYIVSLDGQIAPPARSDATEISYPQITANTAEPVPRERAAIIYRMVCSQCHGITGNGKGINAPYLSEQPRNHRNTDEMRKLSDDHLFQVIKFGGPAVDRSSLMPSWGGTLGDDDIKGLITYLRTISGTTNATNAPKRDNP